jgi:hypothetical protein
VRRSAQAVSISLCGLDPRCEVHISIQLSGNKHCSFKGTAACRTQERNRHTGTNQDAHATSVAATRQSDASLPGGYWLPGAAAALYTNRLYRWHQQMRAHRAEGGDPFKSTSTIAALAATVLYVCCLLVGKQLMRNRSPISCKKYMLVYNVYQVRHCSQPDPACHEPRCLEFKMHPNAEFVTCAR